MNNLYGNHATWMAGIAGLLTLLAATCVPVQAGDRTFQETAVERAVTRADLSGAWWRYPQFAQALDPKLPPPPVHGDKPLEPPPPPLREQYKTAWQKKRQAIHEAEEQGRPLFTGMEACLPKGMPEIMARAFPFEFLQTSARVTFIAETFHEVRRIYLDEQQIPIEEAEPRIWGHSVGRWEGDDTLVVDTVGVKEEVRFMDVPHSAEMRIAERIRLLTPDFMRIDFTVTDPVYLARPWEFAFTYQRYPDYEIQEYVCEGNHEYMDPETGEVRMRILE